MPDGLTSLRLMVRWHLNLLNAPNLVQYSGNLRNPVTFDQPGARLTQVFGSGGPRALQLGAALRF